MFVGEIDASDTVLVVMANTQHPGPTAFLALFFFVASILRTPIESIQRVPTEITGTETT